MNNGNAHQSAWSANNAAKGNGAIQGRTAEYWELRHAVICGCANESACISDMKADLGVAR